MKNGKFDEAPKQAQSQLHGLISSGGIKSLRLVGLLVFVAWQSAFFVAPDGEGVIKRFGLPVRTTDLWCHEVIVFYGRTSWLQ